MSYLAHDCPLNRGLWPKEDRAIGILDAVLAYQRPFETAFDTAIRMLIEEALGRTRGQKDAAKLLRVIPRVLVYYKHRWPEIYPTALRSKGAA